MGLQDLNHGCSHDWLAICYPSVNTVNSTPNNAYILCLFSVRFKVLNNNHLQIRGIKKTDEGAYTCEGRLKARGEIDLRVIKVIVNGVQTFLLHTFFLFLFDPACISLRGRCPMMLK